jgi:SnoaL-like domain
MFLDTAVEYYNAMSEKNPADIERCLHPEVRLVSPLAVVTGKEAVAEAAKHLMGFFNKLTVRNKFGAGNHAMVAYDLDCPAPLGLVRAAALLTFKEGLISEIELYYDARPFEKRQKEIFTS